MKIAIHYNKDSFSERWINYCEKKHIDYKLVNAYANDIIQQLNDCSFFMWHFHQGDYRDMQMAKALIFSLETKGIKCFPNGRTCWHFDNKIWQKYLLESVGAPLVPSYVFFTKEEALAWTNKTTFPKVFKLKGGAGSTNVKLAKTQRDAIKLIEQCFSRGFSQYRWQDHLHEACNRKKAGKGSLRDVLRPFYYAFKQYPTDFAHYHQNEIGYAYFQDFIPNNSFDIRICVVGNRAFALKRINRKGDFRASGSGIIVYDKEQIDESCVETAFAVNSILKMQSVAFDFVFDINNQPMIVEISYGYAMRAYDRCEGYWTDDLCWHEGERFDFCGWMVENLIEQ